MKYFALFSIALYFITVYFLKEEPKIVKKNLEQDIVIKKIPTPKKNDQVKPETKTVSKQKDSKPILIKKELAKKVLANFPKSLKTTITPIKEMIYLKHGLQIPALKILISLKNKKGEKSSYNALINKKTGQILQTFNRPHLEFQKPATLKYKGKI